MDQQVDMHTLEHVYNAINGVSSEINSTDQTLRDVVLQEAKELTRQERQSLAKSIKAKIATLTDNGLFQQSINVMTQLATADYEENISKVPYFLSKVITILKKSTDVDVIVAACSLAETLIESGGQACADAAVVVIEQDLKWLKASSKHILSGIVLCRSLVVSSFVLFLPHLQTVISQNMHAIFVKCGPELYEQASLTLEVLLTCASEKMRINELCARFLELVRLLSKSKLEQQSLSTLYVIRALLKSANGFCDENYQVFVTALGDVKQSKSKKVKELVLMTYPLLAWVNKDKFLGCTKDVFPYIVALAKSSDTRSTAFTAIGQLSLVLREAMQPIVKSILPALSSAITDKKKKTTSLSQRTQKLSVRKSCDFEALRCNPLLLQPVTSSLYVSPLATFLPEPEASPGGKTHKRTGSNAAFVGGTQTISNTFQEALQCIISLSKVGALELALVEPLLQQMYAVPFCYLLVNSLHQLWKIFEKLRNPLMEKVLDCIERALITKQNVKGATDTIFVDMNSPETVPAALKSLYTIEFKKVDRLVQIFENGVKPQFSNSSPSIRKKAIKATGAIIRQVYNGIIVVLQEKREPQQLLQPMVSSFDRLEPFSQENGAVVKMSSSDTQPPALFSLLDSGGISTLRQNASMTSRSVLSLSPRRRKHSGALTMTDSESLFGKSSTGTGTSPISPVRLRSKTPTPPIPGDEVDSNGVSSSSVDDDNDVSPVLSPGKLTASALVERLASSIPPSPTLSMCSCVSLIPMIAESDVKSDVDVYTDPPQRYRTLWMFLRQASLDVLSVAINDVDKDVSTTAVNLVANLCESSPSPFAILAKKSTISSRGTASTDGSFPTAAPHASQLQLPPPSVPYLSFPRLFSEDDACAELFMLANSTDFDVRMAALDTLHKISEVNPAKVLPFVREQLIFQLSVISFGKSLSRINDALLVIGKMLDHFGASLRPYASTIMKTVDELIAANLGSPEVSNLIIKIIGSLALADPKLMKQHVFFVVSFIMDILKQHTSSSQAAKREQAYKSLKNMLLYTEVFDDSDTIEMPPHDVVEGAVVNAIVKQKGKLSKYSLLRFLLDKFSAETKPSVRKEALLCIGTLGAVDPVHMMKELSTLSVISSSFSIAYLEVQNKYARSSSSSYPFLVVLVALSKILKNKMLAVHHESALRAVLATVTKFGSAAPSYIDVILPSVFEALEEADEKHRSKYLEMLDALVSVYKARFYPYVERTVSLTCSTWDELSVVAYYNLTCTLLKVFPMEFKTFSKPIFCSFMTEFCKDKTHSREQTAVCIKALLFFCANEYDLYASIVLPLVCSTLTAKTTSTTVLVVTIDSLRLLFECTGVDDYLMSLYQGLCHLLLESEEPLTQRILMTMATMIEASPKRFKLFLSHFEKLLQEHSFSCMKLSVVLDQLKEGKMIPKRLDKRVAFRLSVTNTTTTTTATSTTTNAPATTATTSASSGTSDAAKKKEQEKKEQAQFTEDRRRKMEAADLEQATTESSNGTIKKLETMADKRQRSQTISSHLDWQDYQQQQQQQQQQRQEKSELLQSFEYLCSATTENFDDFLSNFFNVVLSLAPSPFDYCRSIAKEYPLLAYELIIPALASIYNSKSKESQQRFCTLAERVCLESNANVEVLHFSLLFAEYIEKIGGELYCRHLPEIAMKCRAYAKALRFMEARMLKGPPEKMFQQENTDFLTKLYNHLELPDAAVGVLQLAANAGVKLRVSWLEALGQSYEALEHYSAQIRANAQMANNPRLCLGMIRCCDALGDWERVAEIAEHTISLLLSKQEESPKPFPLPMPTERRRKHSFRNHTTFVDDALATEPSPPSPLPLASPPFSPPIPAPKLQQYPRTPQIPKSTSKAKLVVKQPIQEPSVAPSDISKQERDEMLNTVASLGLEAEWFLGGWDKKDLFIKCMDEQNYQKPLFSAVYEIAKNNFEKAQEHFDVAESILDNQLNALNNESYQRCYKTLINIQKLVNLYDVILYKRSAEMSNGEGKAVQEAIKQLWATQRDGMKTEILDLRTILSIHTLVLRPEDDLVTWIKFIRLCRKTMRAGVAKRTAIRVVGSLEKLESSDLPCALKAVKLEYLRCLWDEATTPREKEGVIARFNAFVEEFRGLPESKLKGKTFLCLGDYERELFASEASSSITAKEVLDNYERATLSDMGSPKAWRAWAQANSSLAHLGEPCTCKNHKHAIEAIGALFKAIENSKTVQFQDILKVLMLFFKYGHNPNAEAAFRASMGTIKSSDWLLAVPQLIARMYSSASASCVVVRDLLCKIGVDHPQALLYPISVAAKSELHERQSIAQYILDSMRDQNSTLVDQALLVSNELIRVSILWHEFWRVGLEEASRCCYVDHSIPGMLRVLRPLYQMLEKGGETESERDFARRFGAELNSAYELVCAPNPTPAQVEMAWKKYSQIYEELGKVLEGMSVLQLEEIAPTLTQVKDFELAVPGSYRSDKPIVTIKSINHRVVVIPSKQRPRKLEIIGSDGVSYMFLLKSHEDLRLDERILQLFNLLNSLLASDKELAKQQLRIGTFDAVPLSPNSGLLSWVLDADTYHELIRKYREKKSIVLNVEHKIMEESCGSFYQGCTVYQKLELFREAEARTSPYDLANIMWDISPNSEVWLEKRNTYTKSVAVMSMVGYILGLGDRHPSNIMLSRSTGLLIHIDFGDCFEAAMIREKFPEKVPFRLTRMMRKAMGVTETEGIFRETCEKVMNLLHQSIDSLMSVLEAFVYEPLINWRILTNEQCKTTDELRGFLTGYDEGQGDEKFNQRAVAVLTKVYKKLTGRDFGSKAIDVDAQVDKLINLATLDESLCQSYVGWCPFW